MEAQHRFNWGRCGWRHPLLSDLLYRTQVGAQHEAQLHELDPERVEWFDDRPTLADLEAQARKAIGAGKHGHGDFGEWELWFRLHILLADSAKVPCDSRRLLVYVSTAQEGGGLMLHADYLDHRSHHRPLLEGRTEWDHEESWAMCWRSASRLAWFLGA